MSVTTQPPAASSAEPGPSQPRLARAEGAEPLGPVDRSGYRKGAALVRRGDGQMVHLGPLMYGLFECIDGRRDLGELAAAMSERLERPVGSEHVRALAERLAAQGLLAGAEHHAPPKRSPLLALRWKVLVTDPRRTARLTAPFTVLFRPWVVGPVLACFVATLWFVLVDKGIASATAQAFDRPGLLLLVFVLAVLSAGFHELGHASACRYSGAVPSGMGAGIYMVWPAFYTDVTDSYRLPRRDRLRVDLGGLYFNAVAAVVTMGVWLLVRADALLLLVGLQVLTMVKQMSPAIRADGYHILSDITGVPDLFSHLGPTVRRLVPGRREPSALTGRARVLVTAWVLVIVPVILSLSVSAVLLLPRIAATAWHSGDRLVTRLPGQVGHAHVIEALASLLQLFALALPVVGTILMAQKLVRMTVDRARAWSDRRAPRQAIVALGAAAALAGLAWAWWPAGQYHPVSPHEDWTLAGIARQASSPRSPAPRLNATSLDAPPKLAPGRHLAIAMIPHGGATTKHPALFIVRGSKDQPPAVILGTHVPAVASAGAMTTGAAGSSPPAAGAASPATSTGGESAPSSSSSAVAFPFKLPEAAKPGETRALATGKVDGAIVYDVAYALVTVRAGAPVTQTNSAYALAHCNACTTIAVSFQVVLVVGKSKLIAPVNIAEALNNGCPACVTAAIADQIVVALRDEPSPDLVNRVTAALKQLDAIKSLGDAGTPASVAAQVAAVQEAIDDALASSGQLPAQTSTTATTPAATSTTPDTPAATSTTPAPTAPATSTTPGTAPTTTSAAPASTTTTTPAATPAAPPTATTTTPSVTPAAPSP